MVEVDLTDWGKDSDDLMRLTRKRASSVKASEVEDLRKRADNDQADLNRAKDNLKLVRKKVELLRGQCAEELRASIPRAVQEKMVKLQSDLELDLKNIDRIELMAGELQAPHMNGINKGVREIDPQSSDVDAKVSDMKKRMDDIEPKIAKLLDRAPNIDVLSTAGRGHYVFIAHIDTAPFDNNDLRLALKYALNREEMVEKILQGYGSIGNDMPINAAYPLFDDTIPQREFNLEKAAEHYKKSGHDGSPIILRTADGAFPGAVDAAALFQQSCQAAGIPLEIKR